MAIHTRGAERKAFRSPGLLIAGTALVAGLWAFVAGKEFERHWGVEVQQVLEQLIEAKKELKQVQTELDVFLKYIQPEIDSVYQMSQSRALTYHFFRYGIKTGTPPRLLAAMARVESNYTPGAVSNKGASGILQVMPNLWWRLVVAKCGFWERGDSRVEICGGAYVLAYYRDSCSGDYKCALSRYYSGAETRVGKQYAAAVISGL